MSSEQRAVHVNALTSDCSHIINRPNGCFYQDHSISGPDQIENLDSARRWTAAYAPAIYRLAVFHGRSFPTRPS